MASYLLPTKAASSSKWKQLFLGHYVLYNYSILRLNSDTVQQESTIPFRTFKAVGHIK